jgi:hypothetical protein
MMMMMNLFFFYSVQQQLAMMMPLPVPAPAVVAILAATACCLPIIAWRDSKDVLFVYYPRFACCPVAFGHASLTFVLLPECIHFAWIVFPVPVVLLVVCVFY